MAVCSRICFTRIGVVVGADLAVRAVGRPAGVGQEQPAEVVVGAQPVAYARRSRPRAGCRRRRSPAGSRDRGGGRSDRRPARRSRRPCRGRHRGPDWAGWWPDPPPAVGDRDQDPERASGGRLMAPCQASAMVSRSIALQHRAAAAIVRGLTPAAPLDGGDVPRLRGQRQPDRVGVRVAVRAGSSVAMGRRCYLPQKCDPGHISRTRRSAGRPSMIDAEVRGYLNPRAGNHGLRLSCPDGAAAGRDAHRRGARCRGPVGVAGR